MTDKQKQILSLVLTAVISLVVGVCGVFGIQVYSSCASTGSVDWDIILRDVQENRGKRLFYDW